MHAPFPLAQEAEALLASRLKRLREPTTKLAAFETVRGRQLALARERMGEIYIWVEAIGADVTGVEINNQKHPGMPYAPEQPRSSAVNTQCSRLREGCTAYYLRCETLGALERFLDWYCRY
ncbi:hypothetical protein [Piscinibacterium candidicorallinum]|uniref:Transposase n=1 Tax=Piscinibacterium candidicorallinum TaxID=1793872 RepID=A0ABV7H007_9BURK